MTPRARIHAAILLGVWIASALWCLRWLDHGWWPNNSGAFALSAERVLGGELPHHDFDEVYTGGVAFLHALGFEVLGEDMAAMRRVLFLVFLAWVPSVWYVATRFAGVAIAGLVTLLSAAWSICMYPEPIASHYNVYFATFGLAALLRFLETGRRRWLVLVGACAGLSILAKIIGLYFLIAACVTLLFREQTEARGTQAPAAGRGSRTLAIAYRAVLAACALVGTAALAAIVFRWHGAAGLVHFVLPVALIAAVLVRNELAGPPRPAASRFCEHVGLLGPVVLGLCAVIAPFLVPYAMTGSLGDLARGLFVAPSKRLAFTVVPPPMFTWAALTVLVLLAWAPRLTRIPSLVLAGVLAAGAIAWILLRDPNDLEPALVDCLRATAPAAVVAGCVQLCRSRPPGDRRAAAVFASLAATAFCGLVQFPTALAIYFVFVMPLAFLSAVAVFAEARGAGRAPLAIALLVLLVVAFPVIGYVHRQETAALGIDRAGGLLVRPAEARQYRELVELVRGLAGGAAIYAAPDCPEVYFLCGSPNPTRTTYDFFDDPEGRTARIVDSLARHRVRVVVLNQKPQFSGPPPAELIAHLSQAYPRATVVGNFEVRWQP